jgi:hypothetical protein
MARGGQERRERVRRSSAVLLVVGLAGLAASAVWLRTPARPPRTTATRDAVASVLGRAADAVARRDSAAVARLIAPEARVLGRTRAQLERSLEALFASRGFPTLRLEWGDPEVRTRGATASLRVNMTVRERTADLDIVYARSLLTLALQRQRTGDGTAEWVITAADARPPIDVPDAPEP